MVESADLCFVQFKLPPGFGIGYADVFNDFNDTFAGFFPLGFKFEEGVVRSLACLADVSENTVFASNSRSFWAIVSGWCGCWSWSWS